MKVNEGGLDRIVRIVVGIALLGAAYFYLAGTTAIVVAILGAIALVTGLVGICPAYSILGLSTCPLRRAD